MTTVSLGIPRRITAMSDDAGITIRHAGRDALAAALLDSRRDTLATFAVFEQALQGTGLRIPYRSEVNPPLWELGHIGWFQEWWIARNAQRGRGTAADPDVPRPRGVRADADALYHSSRVPHASRWSLPLPDADATRGDLARQLQTTLSMLADTPETDDALYFFRLALLHEDMHHEAALGIALTLGIDLPPRAAGDAPIRPSARAELALDGGRFTLGSSGPGFAFDNELAAHPVMLGALAIDRDVVRWADFLPFIESGASSDPRCWSEAGWRWRQGRPASTPRDLRQADGAWQQRHGSRWTALDRRAPAAPLCGFEADAWCRWAGRRLPSEAEWEHAALAAGPDFAWGEVWEWTASAFAPYPGFTPHPYRDYSAPWFDGRPVLRGASVHTQARMRHPRYRNFYTAERCDVLAGFRSCRS
jgi:gamma-glutamyl hercynylcysteine S-oxide synthase